MFGNSGFPSLIKVDSVNKSNPPWLKCARSRTSVASAVLLAAVLLGGPALYLLGNLLFKRATANRPALSHVVGLGLLVLVTPLALVVQPLTFSALTTLVLVAVAIWETLSLRGVESHEPAVDVSSSERTSGDMPAG